MMYDIKELKRLAESSNDTGEMILWLERQEISTELVDAELKEEISLDRIPGPVIWVTADLFDNTEELPVFRNPRNFVAYLEETVLDYVFGGA